MTTATEAMDTKGLHREGIMRGITLIDLLLGGTMRVEAEVGEI